MEGKGYKSVNEMRGMALPNIIKTADVPREPEDVKVTIDTSKCTRCGICLRSCFYDAITLTKAGAVINEEKCDVCGLCAEVCPEHASRVHYL
jgi:dihydropyrimidine dehydrogenase (NAD+) subunit PreA